MKLFKECPDRDIQNMFGSVSMIILIGLAIATKHTFIVFVLTMVIMFNSLMAMMFIMGLSMFSSIKDHDILDPEIRKSWQFIIMEGVVLSVGMCYGGFIPHGCLYMLCSGTYSLFSYKFWKYRDTVYTEKLIKKGKEIVNDIT